MDKAIPLNDPLNLRDFITAVTDHIRENAVTDTAPKNIVGFFALILTGEDNGDTRKDNQVFMMQRLFSGNIHYGAKAVQALAGEIRSGEMDPLLLERLALVADAIRSSPRGEDFLSGLMDKCSPRFFSPEELQTLQALRQSADHPGFLLALLKHGFGTLFNLPCFFAQRMYEDDATTLDWDAPHRHALMKIAADHGSRDAAMEYGNFLARSGAGSEADRYFMMALPKPSALWSVAYQMEIRWIDPKRIPIIQSAYKVDEKLAGEEFAPFRDELEDIAYGGPDPDYADTMIYVYKVYFSLAYQDYFKAFHSLAKQLETGTIYFDCPEGKAKAARLRQKYRDASIRASNVISILSEGNYLLQARMEAGLYDPSSPEEAKLLELLEIAADMDLLYGHFHLGEYYEYASHRDPRQQDLREKARMHYLRAEQLDMDKDGRQGMLWLRLGIVSSAPEEKRRYLDKALKAKQWDAAYYLADLESEQYLSGGSSRQLNLYTALKLLNEHLPLFSAEVKERAAFLFRALRSSADGEENRAAGISI